MQFPVVVFKDEKSDYGVMVPDLPRCIAAGPTLEMAVANARTAIEQHVTSLAASGQPLPQPSNIDSLIRMNEWQGGMWTTVSVEPSPEPVVGSRGGITLPARMREAIGGSSTIREPQASRSQNDLAGPADQMTLAGPVPACGPVNTRHGRRRRRRLPELPEASLAPFESVAKADSSQAATEPGWKPKMPLESAWISEGLLANTQEVWSKTYKRPVERDEAIEMLLNVRRLAEVLMRPHLEAKRDCPRQEPSTLTPALAQKNCPKEEPSSLAQALTRQEWILLQLRNGRPLRSPMIAEAFKCSERTAKRDLASMKAEGLIEFKGHGQTGCYRISAGERKDVPPTESPSGSGST